MIIDHLWQKQKALGRLIYSLRSVQSDVKIDKHSSLPAHPLPKKIQSRWKTSFQDETQRAREDGKQQ